MYNQEMSIPFGLLYEEVAPNPREIFHPTYDEMEDLSFLEDGQGRRIPFVEFGNDFGTQTETYVYRESTDTDPGDDHSNVVVLATETSTAVKAETTDTDPEEDNTQSSRRFGIDTVTAIRPKPKNIYSDNICESQIVGRSFLATDTITKMDNEQTDTD